MGKTFVGENWCLYSYEMFCSRFEKEADNESYLQWVMAMLPVRKEIEFYLYKNEYYGRCVAAGRKDALAENIAVEMAYRLVGWMPDAEWVVHRMRPPLTAAHLRGFADGLEPKPQVAAGRPSKYPWGKLDSEADGYCFTLSPGEGQPKLATVRVLASRKRKQTGMAISCRQLDDGSIEVRRVG